MKLLKLSMSAFGPYAGTETIDFRPFYRDGLLLIRGETGSGKTSILDAMTFVFFGQSSGGNRGDIQALRCHHSPLSAETCVICDAAVARGLFRFKVRFRMIARRNGTVEPSAPEYTIFQLSDRSDPETIAGYDDDLAHDSGILKESNLRQKEAWRMAEDLLGLTYEQFCQVVILPQGAFGRFLLAPSRDKEEILNSIFGTAFYQQVADQLKLTAGLREQAARRTDEQMRSILDPLEAGTTDDFERLVNNQIASAKQLAEHHLQTKTALETARLAHQDGWQLAGQFRRRAELTAQAAELSGRQKDMAALQTDIRRAEAAAGLGALFRQMDRLADEQAAADQALKDAREKEIEVTRQREDYDNLSKDTPDLERTLKKTEDDLQWLAQIQDSWKRQQTLKSELVKAETASRAAETRFKNMRDEQQRLRTAAADQASIRQLLADLKLADLDRRHRQTEWSGWAAQLKQMQQTADELGRLRSRMAELDAQQLKLEQACEAQQLILDRRRADQAVYWAERLSDQLRPGDPCPVCGQPYCQTDEAVRSKSFGDTASEPSVRAVEQKLADLAARREQTGLEAAALHASVPERISALKRQFEDLNGSLGGISETGMASDGEIDWVQACGALALQLQTIRQKYAETDEALPVRLAEAEKRMAEADALQSTISRMDAELAAQQQACQTLALKVNHLSGQLAALDLTVETSRCRRIANYLGLTTSANRADDAASARIQQTAGRCGEADQMTAASEENDPEQLAAQLAERRRQLNQTLSDRTAQKLAIEAAGHAAQLELERCQTAAESLKQQAAVFQAETDQSVRRTGEPEATLRAALKSDTELAEMKAILDRWTEAMTQTRVELSLLEERLTGQAEPDVEALTLALERAEADADAALTDLTTAQNRLAAMKQSLKTLKQLDRQYARQTADLLKYQHFTKLVRGEQGVSLRRFVLSRMLMSVIQSANSLLERVHDGRYRLDVSDTRQSRERQVGLNFVVHDAYTGQPRSVVTLSGGEQFLVSLALSLGLSSVVQMQTNGIPIQSMFIDEGFGTLDAASLAEATDMLIRHRQSDRLVGIISHIESLTGTLPQVLEIIKMPLGSQIRVQI